MRRLARVNNSGMNTKKTQAFFTTLSGVALAITLFAISCGEKPNAARKKLDVQSDFINADDIDFLIIGTSNLIPSRGSIVTDEKYMLHPKDWYLSALHEICAKKFWDKDYTEQSGDCDDYVRVVLGAVSERFWSAKEACPIGQISYFKTLPNEPSRGHVIIMFVYREGNEAKVGFYEPNTKLSGWVGGKEVQLSEEEIKTCTYWTI